MLTPDEIRFITENKDADTSRLLLNASKKGDTSGPDIPLCVKCIEARRKTESKIPLWHANGKLVYPFPLSVEQCSSQAAALYKQKIIKELLTDSNIFTADMTGGMGVDSYFISLAVCKHYYVERSEGLCKAAKYNFKELGAGNITVINAECLPENRELFNFFSDKKLSLIYLDPARRSKTDSKVISLKEYEPNLLELKEELFRLAPFLLVKVSPMADIKLNLRLLPETVQIHIISVDNECKELLFLLVSPEYVFQADKVHDNAFCKAGGTACSGHFISIAQQNSPEIYAVNIAGSGKEHPHYGGCENVFRFRLTEEEEATASFTNTIEKYLYEPDKQVLKSGAYKLVSQRFGLKKLAPSTHLYTSEILKTSFPGKVFQVKEVCNFNKKDIKKIAVKYPRADLSARNFPLDTNNLKKLSGIKDGGSDHIFAVTLYDGSRKIIICSRRENRPEQQ